MLSLFCSGCSGSGGYDVSIDNASCALSVLEAAVWLRVTPLLQVEIIVFVVSDNNNSFPYSGCGSYCMLLVVVQLSAAIVFLVTAAISVCYRFSYFYPRGR